MTPADRSALTCIATGIHWCLLSIVQFSNKALAPFVHPQLVPLHDKYPISSEGGLTSRYGYPKWSANGPTNDSLLLFAFNIIQPSNSWGQYHHTQWGLKIGLLPEKASWHPEVRTIQECRCSTQIWWDWGTTCKITVSAKCWFLITKGVPNKHTFKIMVIMQVQSISK